MRQYPHITACWSGTFTKEINSQHKTFHSSLQSCLVKENIWLHLWVWLFFFHDSYILQIEVRKMVKLTHTCQIPSISWKWFYALKTNDNDLYRSWRVQQIESKRWHNVVTMSTNMVTSRIGQPQPCPKKLQLGRTFAPGKSSWRKECCCFM